METCGSSSLHVLLVSIPLQGHINPLLRLGKRLASEGLLVTFSSAESISKDIQKIGHFTSNQPTPIGPGFLRFEFFSDGWAEDEPKRKNPEAYGPQLEVGGKASLLQLIKKQEDVGNPVSCVIYGLFLPWVSAVAAELGIPSAFLWPEACTVFTAYYYYLHKLVPFPTESEPDVEVKLPCMPSLRYDEIPSTLHPMSTYPIMKTGILRQLEKLNKSFCVLMETFDELEHEVVKEMSKLVPIKPIGPLIKYNEVINSSSNGDNYKLDDNITAWLDSKAACSVVYVSFGTLLFLKEEQIIEIAHGLSNSGLSFLWVMRPPHVVAGDQGKVVEWCNQEQVLAHPSIACFMSHCGWNSAVEALTAGVPVVAFPQVGDQVTNAKLLVDVFGVGVRLSRGKAENRLIMRREVEKSLHEITKGERALEMKQNALRWKKMAEEAVAKGGSSERNIKAFVEEIKRKANVTITS